jgi:hypothetical protein
VHGELRGSDRHAYGTLLLVDAIERSHAQRLPADSIDASYICASYTLVLIKKGRDLVRDRDQPFLHAITSIRTKP